MTIIPIGVKLPNPMIHLKLRKHDIIISRINKQLIKSLSSPVVIVIYRSLNFLAVRRPYFFITGSSQIGEIMYKTQFFRKMNFLVYLKENKTNWYETILLKKYSFAIKIEKKDVIKKQIKKYIKSCRDHVICHFLFQNGGSVKWVGVWDEVIAMLLCFVMWFSYWHSKMHFSIPDTQELHDGAGATYTVNDTIWFFCCVIKLG